MTARSYRGLGQKQTLHGLTPWIGIKLADYMIHRREFGVNGIRDYGTTLCLAWSRLLLMVLRWNASTLAHLWDLLLRGDRGRCDVVNVLAYINMDGVRAVYCCRTSCWRDSGYFRKGRFQWLHMDINKELELALQTTLTETTPTGGKPQHEH